MKAQDYIFVRAFVGLLQVCTLVKAWKQSNESSSDVEMIQRKYV